MNIVVHLVSSALQLVILVTQPLYLATGTNPEISDFWICMLTTSRVAVPEDWVTGQEDEQSLALGHKGVTMGRIEFSGLE